MDPFEGTWNNVHCTSPEGIKELLTGATLTIQGDRVTWTFGGGTAPSDATLKAGKLWGEFPFGGKSYYYEIEILTPPLEIKAPKRIYGILGTVHKRSGAGGELGDPGAWKAEEHTEG